MKDACRCFFYQLKNGAGLFSLMLIKLFLSYPAFSPKFKHAITVLKDDV